MPLLHHTVLIVYNPVNSINYSREKAVEGPPQHHIVLTVNYTTNYVVNYREEDEEEEGAITAPDGSKLEEEKKDEEEKKEGEEGEEEEGPQFTEDEEAIVQYLKEDEPLPPEVLDKIVPDWWNKEPFK